MKVLSVTVSLCAVASLLECASASVFMPYSARNALTVRSVAPTTTTSAAQRNAVRELRLALHRRQHTSTTTTSHRNTAMAIPGYGVAEQVFVGGFGNFLGIYNLIITARILLSWFPQAQSVGALQPVYAITDPYLNLFRGLIPPLFGLDFSPILAFFLLSVLQNATVAVGAEIPPHLKDSLPVFNPKTSHQSPKVAVVAK